VIFSDKIISNLSVLPAPEYDSVTAALQKCFTRSQSLSDEHQSNLIVNKGQHFSDERKGATHSWLVPGRRSGVGVSAAVTCSDEKIINLSLLPAPEYENVDTVARIWIFLKYSRKIRKLVWPRPLWLGGWGTVRGHWHDRGEKLPKSANRYARS
jgi:hypothetical protein